MEPRPGRPGRPGRRATRLGKFFHFKNPSSNYPSPFLFLLLIIYLVAQSPKNKEIHRNSSKSPQGNSLGNSLGNSKFGRLKKKQGHTPSLRFLCIGEGYMASANPSVLCVFSAGRETCERPSGAADCRVCGCEWPSGAADFESVEF